MMFLSSASDNIHRPVLLERLTHLSVEEKSSLKSLALRADELRKTIADGHGLWDRFKACFFQSHRKTLADRVAGWHKAADDTASLIRVFATINQRRDELNRLDGGNISSNVDRLLLTAQERGVLKGMLQKPVPTDISQARAITSGIDGAIAAHRQRERIARRVQSIISDVAVAGRADKLAMATLPELSAAYRRGCDAALTGLRRELSVQLATQSPEGLRKALAAAAPSRLEAVALAKLLIALKQEVEQTAETDNRALLEFLQQPVMPRGSMENDAGWYHYLVVTDDPVHALRIAAEQGTSDPAWAFLAADAVDLAKAKEIVAGEDIFATIVLENIRDNGVVSWRDTRRHDYSTVSPRDALRERIDGDCERFRDALSGPGMTASEEQIARLLTDQLSETTTSYILAGQSAHWKNTVEDSQLYWEKHNSAPPAG